MQVRKKKNNLTDLELLKYSRQIVLPEIDIDGQELLAQKRVAIIGLGGIGCPVSMYLATSGVGSMTLVDHDQVSHDNLGRQILFNEEDISRNKAAAAKDKLSKMNSQIELNYIENPINENFNIELLKNADILIDCTDNFKTRTLINTISIKLKKPLLMGSALKFEGHIASFRNDTDNNPCYRCLYPELPDVVDACVDSGVLGSLTGAVGSLVATECIKLLCNFGETLESRLLILDLKYNSFKCINLRQDNECRFCN